MVTIFCATAYYQQLSKNTVCYRFKHTRRRRPGTDAVALAAAKLRPSILKQLLLDSGVMVRTLGLGRALTGKQWNTKETLFQLMLLNVLQNERLH